MRDAITRQRVALLHPAFTPIATKGIETAEDRLGPYAALRVVQGDRTFAEQNEIYCQPFDHKDNDGDGKIDEPDERVTNAKGGQSIHNYGLALDFAILYDKDKNGTFEALSWDLVADLDRDGKADWQEVVGAFKELGCSWGGDWHSSHDNPHIEMGGHSDYRPLLAKYNAKDFIPGTTFVNL